MGRVLEKSVPISIFCFPGVLDARYLARYRLEVQLGHRGYCFQKLSESSTSCLSYSYLHISAVNTGTSSTPRSLSMTLPPECGLGSRDSPSHPQRQHPQHPQQAQPPAPTYSKWNGRANGVKPVFEP
jgi:hypothetical protein